MDETWLDFLLSFFYALLAAAFFKSILLYNAFSDNYTVPFFFGPIPPPSFERAPPMPPGSLNEEFEFWERFSRFKLPSAPPDTLSALDASDT